MQPTAIKAGKLLVDPKKRRRYSLGDLLAQCKPSGRRSRAERDWIAGKSAGRELI
jgi:antitoxin ChpS